MSEDLETLHSAPVGQRTPDGAAGLLDVLHQRWLERTGGDGVVIAAELTRLVSAEPLDSEACVPLMDGHIAAIAKEHIGAERDQAALYRVGKQALRTYVERVAETGRQPVLIDAIDEIEAAFKPGAPAVPEESAAAGVDESMTGPKRPAPRRAARSANKPQAAVPRTQEEIEADRDRGLRLANQVRKKRADVKIGLKEGELSLEEALSDPAVHGLEIAKLLKHVPKAGRVKVGKVLRSARLAAETEIGALSGIEKAQIIALLPPEKHQCPRPQTHQVHDRSQFMESLGRANEARVYRSVAKGKLASMEMGVEELFEDEVASGMRLGEMLASLPAYGRPKDIRRNGVKANGLMRRVLKETNLPGDKRCSDLTTRERRLVLNSLAARNLA